MEREGELDRAIDGFRQSGVADLGLLQFYFRGAGAHDKDHEHVRNAGSAAQNKEFNLLHTHLANTLRGEQRNLYPDRRYGVIGHGRYDVQFQLHSSGI